MARAPASDEVGAVAGWAAVWREWADGLRLIVASRPLRVLMVVVAPALADSLNSPLIVPFVLEVVAGGTAAFGAILAVRGVAGLLGGVVVGWLGARVALGSW